MNNIIIELISQITSFMQYFAPGFIFLSCFDFASYSQREKKFEFFVVKSICISFVIVCCSDFIFTIFEFPSSTRLLFIIVLSAFLGLLIGRISKLFWVNSLINLLFKRSVSKDLFVDLWINTNKNDEMLCTRLFLKKQKGYYEGQISKISTINDKIVIILKYYCFFEKNNKKTVDNSNNETELLIMFEDVSKCEYICAKDGDII